MVNGQINFPTALPNSTRCTGDVGWTAEAIWTHFLSLPKTSSQAHLSLYLVHISRLAQREASRSVNFCPFHSYLNQLGATYSLNMQFHVQTHGNKEAIILFLPGKTSFSSGLLRIHPFLCWMMHWNIFQSYQPTDLYNDVTPVCWYRFTFSWLHYYDSNDCLFRDRCWRATTAPSNWQLWGCKPIPPFAHQRPRLGYPWQDLDRELSANFGYFRYLLPPTRRHTITPSAGHSSKLQKMLYS